MSETGSSESSGFGAWKFQEAQAARRRGSVQVQGGFYGPAAAQMGLGYTITGAAGGNRTISGVGVLQKGP